MTFEAIEELLGQTNNEKDELNKNGRNDSLPAITRKVTFDGIFC